MKNILFIFLLITLNSYIYDKIENFQLSADKEIEKEKPGLSKTISIKYFQKKILTFENKTENAQLQVNIHSINCNIEVEPKENINNKINFNTYSIIINPADQNITIEPILDEVDGEYIENYNQKNCYLSINSYYLNNSQPKLKIENKEENIIYFNHQKKFQISYEIKNITNENFFLMNLRFEDCQFSIDISYYINNQIKSTSKQANDSINIYLNSDFLTNINESAKAIGQDGKIYINISNHKEDKSSIIHLKIIEKNTICLLEKNALNFGFLTTNLNNQYYYMEIFEKEEGELILHNKRFYGELYGKIIEKNKIKESDLTDIFKYPNSTSNESLLEYHQHYLKLNYDYKNTSHCFNGCYLLITYKKLPFKGDFPNLGYEFTILSRTWNYTDYITQIIDIPYNEFIIGCFEQNTAQNHYYSIKIPEDTEKIIIEIESNYLEFFYDGGRKHINTINPVKSTIKLNLSNNKGVYPLNIAELNLTNKTLSFALRPKNYYSNIFSFYYFRVILLKENKELYYPINSYLGNLCIPKYNNTKYYCNFILKNNYNESDFKFAISSTNHNEYFNIYASKVYKNGSLYDDNKEFIYINNNITEDIDYYIFKFEFSNNEIKTIIISFWDTVEKIYPQIYSTQMFYIHNFTRINEFQIKNKYSLIYQYINGSFGGVKFSNINEDILATRNYRGRPLAILIDDNINVSNNTANSPFIYYYQLIYNNKDGNIEEVKLGEPRSQIINRKQFPLYFYLKLKEDKDVNVIVNLRLKANIDSELEDDIEIKGYLLNNNDINRKINGEYIQLKEPIEGYFSNGLNIGYLEIIREYNENNSYLLIEIQKLENPEFNSYILIDVVANEYDDNNTFRLPMNRYIFETFNGINNTVRAQNKYHININRIGYHSQAFVELSTQYEEIKIKFESEEELNITLYNVSGFKKYRINNTEHHNIYFTVLNPEKKIANYMIRYFYTEHDKEYEYYFNEKYDLNKTLSEEYANISLAFKGIKIITGEERNKIVNDTEIYFLITGILYKKQNNNMDECINTTSKTTNYIKYYTNNTRYNYTNVSKNWYLKFDNIPRGNNFVYDLQLQINAILSKSILNEEFLIYNVTIDLTDIEIKNKDLTYILIGVIGGILILIVLFFMIKYIRLRKKNTNLRNEMKSLVFSNDVQNNVINKEKAISKKEKDYETTFI